MLPQGARSCCSATPRDRPAPTEREAGFLEAMPRTPRSEVVSPNQYGGADIESAFKVSEELLSPSRGRDGTPDVDGIFCPNESTTLAMLRALEDNGFAGKVRFIGFDASQQLVEALSRRPHRRPIVQDPVKMGYLGVKTMVPHIRGQQVERRIDTGVRLVTRDSMDEPDVKELLDPIQRWLK